jgi:hypothetical protein
MYRPSHTISSSKHKGLLFRATAIIPNASLPHADGRRQAGLTGGPQYFLAAGLIDPSACGPRQVRLNASPAEESLFGRGQFGAVINAGEKMAVNIGRDADVGVAEAALHHFEGQFEPAIGLPVNAP